MTARPAVMKEGMVAYKRTPGFDELTMPAGLRREHRTRPGVWAAITVVGAGFDTAHSIPPTKS